MTLGVRALVIDGEGRIFLVKHSYVSGWHLPGGGVEAGETWPRRSRASCARRAISSSPSRRACTACSSTIAIPGATMWRCSWCADFRQTAAPVPDHEIVAHGFFAVDELPDDTTAGTRARIARCSAARRSASVGEKPSLADGRVVSLSRITYHLSILMGQWLVADHRGGVSRGGNPSAAITP